MRDIPSRKFEQLESRLLLAVDVSQAGDTLVIDGNDDGDFVEVNGVNGVDGTDQGVLMVFVNGELIDTFEGIANIKAKLRGGDDELHLSAVQITGNVTADMGEGDDRFDLDTDIDSVPVTTDATPFESGGEGLCGNVLIGGNVKVSMGGQAGDYVDIDSNKNLNCCGSGYDSGIGTSGSEGGCNEVHTFLIGKNLTIKDAGNVNIDGDNDCEEVETFAVLDGDINIGKNLTIKSKVVAEVESEISGPPNVYMQNVNVGATTRVELGEGDDGVDIDDCNFTKRLIVSTKGGDDEVSLGQDPLFDPGFTDGNIFRARVNADGGKGTDVLFAGDPANVYSKNLRDDNWETVI